MKVFLRSFSLVLIALTLCFSTACKAKKPNKDNTLVGTLSLSSVAITPTSVVDEYKFDNKLFFKSLQINEDILSEQNIDIPISKSVDINCNSIDLTFNAQNKVKLTFKINTYYKTASNNAIFNETQLTTLDTYVNKTQLNQENQVLINVKNINSSNNKYTYNICFCFDFYRNL